MGRAVGPGGPALTSQPQKGEVYLAEMDPVRGSEQGRKRPVIIFQNKDLERFTSTLLIIPVATNLNRLGWPGTCSIAKGDGGLAEESVALAYQMRALDIRRLEKCYGKLSAETLDLLKRAILNALDIEVTHTA